MSFIGRMLRLARTPALLCIAFASAAACADFPPADRPRPAKLGFNAAREFKQLDPTLWQNLKRLSAQHSCTLFTTLLSAYYVFLHRLSGQNDIVGGNSIPEVSASAARGKDGKLYLALVNTNPKEAVDVAVDVAGAKASSATGSVLTAAAMDAHNTFAAPKAIMPAPFQATVIGGKLTAKLPAKAVVVLTINE